MDKVLKKLGIDETFTTPPKKAKKFTKVRNNIPLVKHYNYMADLLYLPETTDGYKYCLVVVDLATNQFDIEPLKDRKAKDILEAFLKMFERKYIKKPYASVQTDNGKEFLGAFKKWLYNNNIFHKRALKYRHSQNSVVESLNKQLGRLFNGYMNKMEEKTGEEYTDWTDVIDLVRKDLNKYRKINLPKDWKTRSYSIFDTKTEPKFKVGDIVHRALDVPRNALDNEQNTKSFRVGDYRWAKAPNKIVKILYFSGKVPYRYLLNGMNNVSYTENQLMPSKEATEKYQVKKIIDKRTNKKKIEFLIWWKNYLKKEATWESKDKLVEDGFLPEIEAFEKELKKKK